MGKTIQMRDENGKVYPKTIISTQFGLDLTANKKHQDDLIKICDAVVVYYCIFGNTYMKSFYIPRGFTDWFQDIQGGRTIYVRISWSTGEIEVSQYSTSEPLIRVVGYTLIT